MAVASQVLKPCTKKIHLRLVLGTTRIRQEEGGTNQIDWEINGSTGPGCNSPGVCLRNVLI